MGIGIAVIVVVIIGAVVVWWMGRDVAPAEAPSEPTTMWTVSAVVRETPSSISFEVDASLAFSAGQFVLVRPNAQLPFRAYSFSRAPGETLRLTVKQVVNGIVSTHLTQQLKAGDALEVKGPYGQFILPSTANRVLMLAGGSGVTPMLSMLRELEKQGWPKKVTLVDGNRSTPEIIFKAELDALEANSKGALKVLHVLDDGSHGMQGPLTTDVVNKLLLGLDPPDVVAVCGPTPMMDAARKALTGVWPQVKLLEEKFTVEATVAEGAPSHTATLVVGGKEKSFPVKEGEAVLTAARKARVSLQAGCEMGACGTCRVRCLEGSIETPTDACLSDDERAENYALVCVGKVKQPVRFEPAP